MPEHAVMPNMIMTLSLEDIYQIFAAGVAYGAREASDEPPQLTSLLLTLRGRWFDEHLDERLSVLPDGLDWLAAQQTLKERTI